MAGTWILKSIVPVRSHIAVARDESAARHVRYSRRMAIVVYQKPTCTTCRQVYSALKDSGVDFTTVDYYVDPIPREKLIELLRKMQMTPRQLLRTGERLCKELKLGGRELADDAILDLMV